MIQPKNIVAASYWQCFSLENATCLCLRCNPHISLKHRFISFVHSYVLYITYLLAVPLPLMLAAASDASLLAVFNAPAATSWACCMYVLPCSPEVCAPDSACLLKSLAVFEASFATFSAVWDAFWPTLDRVSWADPRAAWAWSPAWLPDDDVSSPSFWEVDFLSPTNVSVHYIREVNWC